EALIDDVFAAQKANLNCTLGSDFFLLNDFGQLLGCRANRRLPGECRIGSRSSFSAERPPAADSPKSAAAGAKGPEINQQAKADHAEVPDRVEAWRFSFATQ